MGLLSALNEGVCQMKELCSAGLFFLGVWLKWHLLSQPLLVGYTPHIINTTFYGKTYFM